MKLFVFLLKRTDGKFAEHFQRSDSISENSPTSTTSINDFKLVEAPQPSKNVKKVPKPQEKGNGVYGKKICYVSIPNKISTIEIYVTLEKVE